MDDSTSLPFRLAPLEPTSEDHFRFPSLTIIEPRFVLPPLDENSPGVERLLTGLERTTFTPVWLEKYDTRDPLLCEPSLEPRRAQAVSNNVAETREEEDVATNDLWRQVAQGEAGPSNLRGLETWDNHAIDDPFLSEQPMGSFESLLVSCEPSINLPKLRTPAAAAPADAKELMDLMMRATLGTTSTNVLRWSRREGRFVYSSSGARPLGVERTTASHLMDEFLTIGTAVRRLEIMVENHAATPLTPTHHALFYALSTILTYVKQKLTAGVESSIAKSSAPWIRRSMLLEDLCELSTALCDVMCWPLNQAKPIGLPVRPASVLTDLHSHLLARLSTSSTHQQSGSITLALAFLLSQAARPFLDLLHQWLGLADSSHADEDNNPDSQPWADLGITRTSLPPADGIDFRWDYSFSSRRMPPFVSREDRRTLFEAGRSLRALHEASGGLHPLCAGKWTLKASWGWDESDGSPPLDLQAHERNVEREIERWRGSHHNRLRTISASSSNSLRTSMHKRRAGSHDPGPAASSPSNPAPSLPALSASKFPCDLWPVFNDPPGSHLPTASHSTPLWIPTPLDELEAFVERYSDPANPLLPSDTPSLELYISTRLLAPLLCHGNIIARALISLYLDDLHFLDHLDVLRAFWLGGDPGFTERVSAALFGEGNAGPGEGHGLGQRARTRARLGIKDEAAGELGGAGQWGIGLGIGLSGRKRWPPGGGELAYALRSTLLEDELGPEAGRMARRGIVWEAIEDRVSFAMRELPDDSDGRRARWRDPQAIEALDFLCLNYKPPVAITKLLPESVMDKYQLINNFLFRLARVDAVVQTLFVDVIHCGPDAMDSVPVKIGVDAKFNRMPSRIGLPTERRRTVFPAGSEGERSLLYLRFTMSWFVSNLSRYVLDTAIGHNWGVMRRRLDKLRRRSRTSASTESRPVTPGVDDGDDEFEDLDQELDEAEGGDEDSATQLGALSQLQSVHSLVLYHQIILNRILRACLLSPQPGHQMTFKVLMVLLGLVLALGKVVKEVDCGMTTPETGADQVIAIKQDWTDKQAVFLHALERLSLRSSSKHASAAMQENDAPASTAASTGQQDLQLLLDGERHGMDQDGNVAKSPHSHTPGSDELQELLLRLRLGTRNTNAGRVGRWRE